VKNVTVLGGENGIDVESSRRVMLDGVHVLGATQDGIHVRFSGVMIRNCTIAMSRPFTQGIDISYSMGDGMSSVEGCDVSGSTEGIVTHSAMVMVMGNRVHGTTLRGITISEMSMGEVSQNEVTGTTGVGVYCGDHSQCDIANNVVTDTRSDGTGNLAERGVGIEANFFAEADLYRNVLVGNPAPVASFDNSEISRSPGR
jgi:nitrous oxidase accessory protein NosD